ncbi:MAG: oligosaccharide flippase family protein [Limnothrix sp.]
MPNPKNLKKKVMRGALSLALRQVVSVGLSVVSILVIARELGPVNYGIVVNALGIYYFLNWTGTLGLHAYLIKQPELEEDAAEQVLAFLNCLGLIMGIGLWFLAPGLGVWTKQPVIGELVRWLPLPIWMNLVSKVSISMLERNLAFGEVGLIEVVGQVSNYLVTVPLVFMGWSYWGPLAGLVFQGFVLFIAAQYFYRVGWRWGWHWSFLKPALAYGITFSASQWIMSLRSLTLPLVVTPLAGVEAAGLVSISVRLAEQLSILRLVIRRMSISVMAKLTGNTQAILKTISRGMAYQAIMIGTLCAAFACIDSWVIPIVFGEAWLPSTQIFPFVALATMVRAMFDLHTAALYASNRNVSVVCAYALYIGLLWLGCALLMPQFGLWGYGIAELLTIGSHFLLHQSVLKLYGFPDYKPALWLTLAAMLPIFSGSLISPIVGILVFIATYSFVLLNPEVRAIAIDLWKTLRSRQKPT